MKPTSWAHLRAIVWHLTLTAEAFLWSIPLKVFVSQLDWLLYEIRIPKLLRKPIFKLWAWYYGCRLNEAEKQPVEEHYTSLHELFTRRLAPGLRSIATKAMVAPVDGSVIQHGILLRVPQHQGDMQREEDEREQAEEEGGFGADYEIDERTPLPGDEAAYDRGAGKRNNLLYVKGIPYRILDLLGVPPLLPEGSNVLHVLSMFLPASEYHHFHSIADCTITHRIRIPGRVMPLLPEKTRMFPHMQWSNERVVLLGHWAHGFFAAVFIAATALVAQVSLDADPELRTNEPLGLLKSVGYLTGWRAPNVIVGSSTQAYGMKGRTGTVPVAGEEGSTPRAGLHVKEFNPPVQYKRGDHVGNFQVGSGLVFVFEAPRDWKLSYNTMVPGHSFKLGEALTEEAA